MMKNEEQLASEISGLSLYTIPVYNTLIFCRPRQQMNSFIDRLNSTQSLISCYVRTLSKDCWPSLDVLVSRQNDVQIKTIDIPKSLLDRSVFAVHYFRAIRKERKQTH